MKKGVKTVTLILIISSALKLLDVAKNLLIASKFGVSENADVYSAVIVLPEYLLIFLGIDTLRGVINSEYSTWIMQKKNEHLINSMIGISSLLFKVTPLIIIGMMLFRSQVISILLPGFTGEKKIIAENVLLIISPLVFFKSFIGFFQSIINSFKRFYLPVLAMSLVSISIVFFILFESNPNNLLYSIAIATLIANAVIFLLLGFRSFSIVKILPGVSLSFKHILKKIFSFRINRSTKSVLKSCFSLILVVVANVLFLGSKNFLASYFGDGAVSAISYASSIPTVVTGLIFGSFFAYFLNRVASIDLSDYASKRNIFYQTLIGLLLFLTFIVSYIVIYAREILEFLYMRGNFTMDGVTMTYYPFIWESLSMLTFALTIVPTGFFIAVKRYTLLNKFGTILYLSGIFLCYLFSQLFGYSGISSGVFFVQLIYGFLLVYLVNREIGGFSSFRNEIFKVVSIAVICLGFTFMIKIYLLNFFVIASINYNMQAILYSGVLHCLIFYAIAWIFKMEQFKGLIKRNF